MFLDATIFIFAVEVAHVTFSRGKHIHCLVDLYSKSLVVLDGRAVVQENMRSCLESLECTYGGNIQDTDLCEVIKSDPQSEISNEIIQPETPSSSFAVVAGYFESFGYIIRKYTALDTVVDQLSSTSVYLYNSALGIRELQIFRRNSLKPVRNIYFDTDIPVGSEFMDMISDPVVLKDYRVVTSIRSDDKDSIVAVFRRYSDIDACAATEKHTLCGRKVLLILRNEGNQKLKNDTIVVGSNLQVISIEDIHDTLLRQHRST